MIDPSILFHGNLMKYDMISNAHKEQEEKILNKINEKKLNYLKLSQGFRDAYFKNLETNNERTD